MQRFISVLSLVLFSLLASGQWAAADTYVVNPEGTGDLPTIQAAIDSVQNGDIIELTDGTFIGNGNRDLDYLGKAITMRSQSGNPEACIIDCEASDLDPHRGFHFHSGESSASVLQGVTITNAYAAGEGADCRGGGIFCEQNSSPTFINCALTANTATYGGGMSCYGGEPTITYCSFTGNGADRGAGLHYYGSGVALTDCTFSGNAAGQNGGGMWGDGLVGFRATAGDLGPSSCPTLNECTFSGNTAQNGGGMFCQWDMPILTGCIFSDNVAVQNGGGMECEGSDPVLSECIFSGNSATEGGGIYCFFFHCPELTHCIFSANTADCGGGMYCYYSTSPTVVSCTFSGNSATEGGGICCAESAAPTFENTLIVFSTSGEAVRCDVSSSATLACCDVFGNTGGNWVGCIEGQSGGTNLCEDPQFCSETPDDHMNWTLQSDSPCALEHCACGLIGAQDVACGGNPVEKMSWGAVKAMFKQ